MAAPSIQQKLLRIRAPRVRITYEVETGGSSEKVELPFIVGMFANLSGELDSSLLPVLKDRTMRDIDSESFDKILAESRPLIKLAAIQDLITGGGKNLQNTLSFTCLSDFEPLAVVKNIPVIAQRFDARGDLRSLQSMAECNDPLAAALDQSILDAGAMGALKIDFTSATPADWINVALVASDAPLESPLLGKDVPVALITLLQHQMSGNIAAAGTAKLAADVAQAAAVAAKADAEAKAQALTTAQDGISSTTIALNNAATAAKSATGDDAMAAANTALAAAQHASDDAATVFTQAQLDASTSAALMARTAQVAADRQSAFLAIDPLSKARRLVGRFTREIILPMGSKELTQIALGANGLIDERTLGIDVQIGLQLDAVMHAPNFKEIEATWRGLFYFVSRAETGVMLKLRVYNTNKDELRKELEKAADFDQSCIFKMIYEGEFGTYGGTPYSLLVGGYEFGRSPDDMSLLTNITKVAASAHAPFLAAAGAGLFGLDGFDQLAKPRDLSQLFESPEMEQWREFRTSEDSRYVALALPHVLLRLPYGKDSRAAEGVKYEESTHDADGSDHDAFLWGNAAFVMAERIVNAFSLYRWTAAIRGVEGGGLVDGLPVYTYRDDSDLVNMICPTEVAITDRREKELNDLGFIALCNCKGTGQAAFFGGQTTNLPRQYISDDANANAKLSAMLPYILAASRFAHYIKVIMRKKIGAFLTRTNIEAYLNTWIAQYVLLDDNASQEVKASYPLRSAQISVTDVPGSPGSYKATVFIKPHFQLEELTTSIRLVADLPAN